MLYRDKIVRDRPVLLAAHLVGKQLKPGGDFVLVSCLNERHFTTAAKQEPRHLNNKPLHEYRHAHTWLLP